MGSRKQGERSKDPEVGRSQQESDERFSAAELGVGGGGDPLSPPRLCPDLKRQDSATPSPRGRTMGSNYPSPGSGYVEAKSNKDRLPGGAPRDIPGSRPLLGDALGQLGAGSRGVGREDSVAGAGGVHGRAGGGAGSRGAESGGHGERGQQQQLLGHRPARGRSYSRPAAGLQGGAVGPRRGGTEKPGTGGKRSETPTLLVQKATKGSGATRARCDLRRSHLKASDDGTTPSGNRKGAARAPAQSPSQMRAGRWATLYKLVFRGKHHGFTPPPDLVAPREFFCSHLLGWCSLTW